MADKIKTFPTYNITLAESVAIVKYRMDDDDVALQTKVLAIENVAHMETHNCITKDDFVRALRWLFEHYEF